MLKVGEYIDYSKQYPHKSWCAEIFSEDEIDNINADTYDSDMDMVVCQELYAELEVMSSEELKKWHQEWQLEHLV